MTSVLLPTEYDLRVQREELLAAMPFDEAELVARGDEGLLTPEEARVLRRLAEIHYLLGE
ncbi:MAG: hypothetical protein F2829_03385 [Actinobacteria bacterium]|nr:hypothetical protein [Actinomycetota bacterium]